MIQVAMRVAALALLLCVATDSLAQQRRGGDRPANVLVSAIAFEAEKERIQAVGTAEAVRSVTLFPAVADRVTEVLFKPGDKVKAGQVLLHLDDRRQQVAAERARITLDDARRNVTRLRESRKKGAIPESELDDAITQMELAEVALKEAQVELEDRLVRAPFDGVVGLTDVETGDRINEQTVITTLDDREHLFINFTAPEVAIPLLTQQPNLQLRPWLDLNLPVTAVIEQVDSRVSSEDRTVRVRALLTNTDDRFRPGMSFRVELDIQGQMYASVPEIALLWDATGAYIWISEEGKAKRVNVDIKQRQPGRILVDGELSEGQMLVTEGIQRLRPGQSLKVANES